MEIRNEKLYVAMRDYVAAAIAFVVDRARHETNFSEDHFNRYWVRARQGTDFSEVPNYAICLELLRADNAISEHLNQRVGLTPSAERMMELVLDLGRVENGYDFDSNHFNEEYLIFEKTFYNELLVCSAFAPVEGLLWDAKPLQLKEGLVISQLRQEEMPWHWIEDSLHWNKLWCAVRVRYELPKFFRALTDRRTYNDLQRDIEQKVRDQIEQVLNALRLFGNCFDFYYSGVLVQKPKWLMEQVRWVKNRALGTGMADYLLTGPDCESFKLLWRRLEVPKTREHVEVTLRRLGDSCIRYRDEDKLVDLMIAAESFFLRGKYGRQKSSAVATLASKYLTLDADLQSQIEGHFKIAYKLRNAIVHEGHINDVLDVNGEPLDHFVGKMQGYMRLAIMKRCADSDAGILS